jgi:hypothetical protein
MADPGPSDAGPSDPDARKVSSLGTKPNPQRKLWDMPKFGMQRVAAGQPAPALGTTRLGGLGSGSEVSADDGENGDESGSEAEQDVRELAQRERDHRAARRAAMKE